MEFGHYYDLYSLCSFSAVHRVNFPTKIHIIHLQNRRFKMGRKSTLSAEEIGQLRAYFSLGTHTTREIAAIMNRSAMTICRYKKKHDAGQPMTENKHCNAGRKRADSPRQLRYLINMVKSDRSQSSKDLALAWQEAGVHVKPAVVRRKLTEAGIFACRPTKKPRLTKRMKRQRLRWARAFKSWTLEDWRQVAFSDESSIETLQDRRKFVRRKATEKDLPECIKEVVKFPEKVMIWSLISAHGTGRVRIVEGTMDSLKYRDVIDEELVPQGEEWFPDGNYIFQQDGAPCHRSKLIKNHLHAMGLQVLPWPGNSPDLNPIEGLWNDLKNEVNKVQVTNKEQLVERIQEVWHGNGRLAELAKQYIDSMPRRVAAVIAARGGHTKY